MDDSRLINPSGEVMYSTAQRRAVKTLIRYAVLHGRVIRVVETYGRYLLVDADMRPTLCPLTFASAKDALAHFHLVHKPDPINGCWCPHAPTE